MAHDSAGISPGAGQAFAEAASGATVVPVPAVTVLLTVYNGMPYLPLTVESIFRQTLENFVFLVINNGSTDGTANFLHSLADARLVIHHLPENIGRTAALNYGLERVATEFTAVIDADDLASPDRLATQVAFLRDHPQVGFVGANVVYIDATGAYIGNDDFPTGHNALLGQMTVYNPFAHAACAFRTGAVKGVGGYPARYVYAQDLGLWMALVREGWQAASIDQQLASIRRHPAQATRDTTQEALRLREQRNLARELAELPGLHPFTAQAARVRLFALVRAQDRADRGEAHNELRRALDYGLVRLLVNPFLWKRAVVALQRLWQRCTRKLVKK